MLLRPLVLLATAIGLVACVVTPKDVTLEASKDTLKKDSNSTKEVKEDSKDKDAQAEGTSRVSQHFPEQHVRLQHLDLPHQQVCNFRGVLTKVY
jgi:hypothetical protein